MANTVVQQGNQIIYTSDGGVNDIDFADPDGLNLIDGCLVASIEMLSAKAGSTAKIYDKRWLSGEPFFVPPNGIDQAGSGIMQYYTWELCFPYIKGGDVDAGTKIAIFMRPPAASEQVIPSNLWLPGSRDL